jgi:hypothetical protein
MVPGTAWRAGARVEVVVSVMTWCSWFIEKGCAVSAFERSRR